MSDRGLGVKSPQVIHESIDGEVIIIDLGTGTYYSAKGSGAEVWEAIHRSPGVTADALAAAVATAYDLPAEEVAEHVQVFVSELLSEEIIVADAQAGDGAAASIERNGAASGPFAPPKLEKYTDMQDLVLIDPVHEVDATGWPERQAEAVPHGAND